MSLSDVPLPNCNLRAGMVILSLSEESLLDVPLSDLPPLSDEQLLDVPLLDEPLLDVSLLDEPLLDVSLPDESLPVDPLPLSDMLGIISANEEVLA